MVFGMFKHAGRVDRQTGQTGKYNKTCKLDPWVSRTDTKRRRTEAYRNSCRTHLDRNRYSGNIAKKNEESDRKILQAGCTVNQSKLESTLEVEIAGTL
jgi:hypothetical protein